MAPLATWRSLPLFAAFAILSTACVAPARSFGAYQGKAQATADDALSAVQTAALAVDAAAHAKATAAYLSVVLVQAEDTASSVQGTFDSVQPPGVRADELRSNLDDILQDALDVLSDLRIAVRRGELEQLSGKSADLMHVATELRKFHDEHAS
jgi:hypothetical protein